tara:strand:+ start:49 stop:1158 length:1110 start_codon:yes stop_codon:yes gene_type:complete
MKYYCKRAFDHAQMMDNGEIIPCCPPWVDHYSYGNINDGSYEEIWNSEKAQAFRESILDGSYRFCNENSCPYLTAKIDPVVPIENLTAEIQKDVIHKKTILDHGPFEVQFCYDRSCNLSCPSCRREVIVVSGKRKEEILEIQEKFKSGFLKNAKTFVITGSGDAFASPVFRKFLQTLQKSDAPELEDIVILTNGLFLPKYWDTLSSFAIEKITTISVSIDASKEETYNINRRGGDWEELLDSLRFISNLSPTFSASFVVQENNFVEMRPFVQMCMDYSVDHIQFQIIEPDFIRDLGYNDYLDEWINKAVHEKSHPKHNDLLKIIKDEFFDPYISNSVRGNDKELTIDMGPLYNLRNGEDISQYNMMRQK